MNVEDMDTKEIEFSPEQMQYLKDKFNIELSNNKEVLAVRDGFVGINDKVWWHGEDGPEFVYVSEDYKNIKDYPEVYSIKKPKYRIVYDWQESEKSCKESKTESENQVEEEGWVLNTGVQPVEDDVLVEVEYRDGEDRIAPACDFRWYFCDHLDYLASGDIIKWRKVK